MKQLILDTKVFATQILRVVPAIGPWYLSEARSIARGEHLMEELNEFLDPASPSDQADALIDLIYIAAGTLAEMGVTPAQAQRAWDEVHGANMRKVNGSLDKRPSAGPHDAVKPEAWVGPNWDYIRTGDRATWAEIAPQQKFLMGNWEASAPVREKIWGATTPDQARRAWDEAYGANMRKYLTGNWEAGEKICEDRAHRYGSFRERAELVDQIMDAMESHPNWGDQLRSEHRHALRMIAEKMGRIVVGNEPDYPDNWDDIGGYAHLGKEGK